tara:strand:- start:112533 stop:113186 length:654 start_codon:yes stop_codon:yes gene_type:complete
MKQIILSSILLLSACSMFDKAAYEQAEMQAKSNQVVDTSSYWEYQYVTLAKFYEVQCGKAKASFDKWVANKGFEKAEQELPGLCTPVTGLGEHTGKCMPEQGSFTYKLKGVNGKTARVDFIVAGKRCFADVHILTEVIKNKNGRTVCHKGSSTECALYLSKLESDNISFTRDIGHQADIYFKEIGFRGRLFNFYHFETTKSAFEESNNYRTYSSSPY